MTAKSGEREQEFAGLRAPTSRRRSRALEPASAVAVVVIAVLPLEGESAASHSTRTLLESPPRAQDCPVMLACWYFGRPPAAAICACREAARAGLLAARAAVSCFWRVWWVRIRVRVAREERGAAFFWIVGGRPRERRRVGFWRFLVGMVMELMPT